MPQEALRGTKTIKAGKAEIRMGLDQKEENGRQAWEESIQDLKGRWPREILLLTVGTEE